MDRAAVYTFGVLDTLVAGCIWRKIDEASLRTRLLHTDYNNSWTIFCNNTNNACSQFSLSYLPPCFRVERVCPFRTSNNNVFFCLLVDSSVNRDIAHWFVDNCSKATSFGFAEPEMTMFKQTHITAEQCTKLCFWNNLRREIGNAVTQFWFMFD